MIDDAAPPPGSMPPPPDAPPAAPAAGGAFDDRRLVFYSLLTGLCPLIPAPFVDDWIRNQLRIRYVDGLATAKAPTLSREARRHLACGPRQTLGGCLRGCARGVPVRITLYVVGKLLRSTFRKIFYFLAVKDAADTFSRTLHEGYLHRMALADGSLTSDADATTVRTAIVDACDAVDTRSITRLAQGIMTSGRGLMRRGARLLRRSALGRRPEAGDHRPAADTLAREEALLDDMIDELGNQTLASAPDHWAALRRAFEAERQRSAAPSEESPLS